MQGSPCVASLGQSLSYGQVRLMRETWSRVIVVGDHQDKQDGTENRVQDTNVRMLSREDFDAVHLVKLPHGDPGSMSRAEFIRVMTDQVMASPKGEGGNSANIGAALGYG